MFFCLEGALFFKIYFAATICRWFIGMSCLFSLKELNPVWNSPWVWNPSVFLRKPRLFPLVDDFIVAAPYGVLWYTVTDHGRGAHSPKLSTGPGFTSFCHIHHCADLSLSLVCMLSQTLYRAMQFMLLLQYFILNSVVCDYHSHQVKDWVTSHCFPHCESLVQISPLKSAPEGLCELGQD